MSKALAVILSSMLLPVAAFADSPCPSYSFMDTGDYSIQFKTGEAVQVSLARRTITMSMKDNGAVVSTTSSIDAAGTTIAHRTIKKTNEGIGISEKIGATVQIFPTGAIIAVQPADLSRRIPATTVAYDGFTLPECFKGNKQLDLSDSRSLITSEFGPGELDRELSDFAEFTSSLALALDLSKNELTATRSELSQCTDALGLSNTKVAGLVSEVAIFDVNNKYSRVSLSKSLRRIQSSLQDVKAQDKKAFKALVRAFNKIKARNQRGLFERPSISSSN